MPISGILDGSVSALSVLHFIVKLLLDEGLLIVFFFKKKENSVNQPDILDEVRIIIRIN